MASWPVQVGLAGPKPDPSRRPGFLSLSEAFVGIALALARAAVVLAPLGNLVQEGVERFAVWGEAVLYARRHLGVNFSPEDAVGFKLAQLLRQHLARALRQRALQAPKTVSALANLPQDRGLPFATDDVECRHHRTSGEVQTIFFRCAKLLIFNDGIHAVTKTEKGAY